MKRAAIYLRVSTDEQTTANQRPDVRRLARARGLQVVATYEETMSASKSRPRFDEMMKHAHEGRFDALIVWALDRLGRSMIGNIQAVIELDTRGVQVLSVREPWLDNEGPSRSLLIAIFSWWAEQERKQLIARTNAGIARARRRGVRLGRPKTRIDLARARELREGGLSVREVARELRVKVTTLQRALTAEKP